MKKSVFIFNIYLFFQTFENSNLQTAFDYVKYTILLICILLASIVMMLIPVVLCYFMVDNFSNMIGYKNKIKEEMSIEGNSSNYLRSICDKYIEASSNFFKNFIAFLIWNIFSLLYIVFWFENFSEGLREYFYFPFAIFQSLSKSEIFDSIHVYKSNWLFMSAIIVLTFSFSSLGKSIGKDIAESKIKKIN
ncbi:hypothetical protein KCTC32516_00013 [Polaribacter huanghezhanensis]|uniref:hypothetical protein n=1 Tax=Polaribacter huanghezhanensis TaxID=1354726 RepID=UPI0026499601|nr:hypothetical protein [Polaribacter huanghezhanensis]WKD84679.1 hypothetical protein KCTC32516_00013 [Polaribacter huanghezhanensis]